MAHQSKSESPPRLKAVRASRLFHFGASNLGSDFHHRLTAHPRTTGTRTKHARSIGTRAFITLILFAPRKAQILTSLKDLSRSRMASSTSGLVVLSMGARRRTLPMRDRKSVV